MSTHHVEATSGGATCVNDTCRRIALHQEVDRLADARFPIGTSIDPEARIAKLRRRLDQIALRSMMHESHVVRMELLDLLVDAQDWCERIDREAAW